MKKIILFLSVLFLMNIATAQDVEIPLFDEQPVNAPKIGRTAAPLDTLVLTPKPLPEVEVGLDKTQTTPQPKAPEPPVESPVPSEEVKNTPPSAPISLRKESGVIKLKKVEKEEKKEEPLAKSEPVVPQQVPVPAPMPEIAPQVPVTGAQTAEGLENLFGKAHDVRGFEVAGIALGMSPDEVTDSMDAMGYKRTKIQYGIPMFRTSFYEQNCRDRKVYPLSDIRKCIEKQANEEEVKYVSSMTFARPKTKEYIEVLFSSNATDNVVYKLYYENKGDNSLTMTTRNLAKQLRRKDMFWKMMFDTYGLPDDSELIIWGDPQKSYMQASMAGSGYDAYIVMEDKDVQDTDYFSAEDDSKELKYKSPFTFAQTDEDVE